MLVLNVKYSVIYMLPKWPEWKDLRPRSRFNTHIIMEIAHPPFLMKLYPKFEISEKTVSKDYSLERPRRTRNVTTRLRT